MVSECLSLYERCTHFSTSYVLFSSILVSEIFSIDIKCETLYIRFINFHTWNFALNYNNLIILLFRHKFVVYLGIASSYSRNSGNIQSNCRTCDAVTSPEFQMLIIYSFTAIKMDVTSEVQRILLIWLFLPAIQVTLEVEPTNCPSKLTQILNWTVHRLN